MAYRNGLRDAEAMKCSSCDVQKLHTIVAQSRFGSEHVKNTRGSDHFLTLRWRFDVEKVHVIVAGSTFGSQKCQKQRVSSHFLKCQLTIPTHCISIST